MQGNFLSMLRNRKNSRTDPLITVRCCDIIPNPEQPRRDFDDAAMRRLADSIAEHGILQPLAVRREGDGFRLIAGERRLRAAIMCSLDEVPCVVVGESAGSYAELAAIENLTRENLTMFEEAEVYVSLIAEHGMTQEEVARRLSCSQSYVANKIRLLKLSAAERALITENALTERHARALLRIHDAEQRTLALAYIIRRRLNVAQSEEYVEALLAAPQPVEPISPVRGRERISLKDIGVFYNTIDRAIDTVRSAGVDVTSDRKPADGGVEIRILVKNG